MKHRLPGGPHDAGQFRQQRRSPRAGGDDNDVGRQHVSRGQTHFTPAPFGGHGGDRRLGAKTDLPGSRQPGQALDHLPAFDEAGLWVEVAIDIAVRVPGRKASANLQTKKAVVVRAPAW